MYQVPQTRIFTTFGESSVVSTSPLAPCIVAPFYEVRDKMHFGSYVSGGDSAILFPYVGLGGGDAIDPSDLPKAGDPGVFTSIIRNAQVQGYRPITFSSTEGSAGYVGADNKSLYTGMVVAEGGGFAVPAGFPALKVGDTVIHDSDGTKTVCKIAGFMQYDAGSHAISLPTFDTFGDHAESDVTLSGSHSCATNVVIKFLITAGGTVGTDTVTASLYINGVAVQTGIACGTTQVSLSGYTGIDTLKIAFAANKSWAAGDTIEYGLAAPAEADSQVGQGYSVIVLDRTIAAESGDTFTLYYNAGDVVNPTGATWDETGLSLATTLSKNGLSIYSGEVYGTYRIHKGEYTKKVYSVASKPELEGLLGEIHPLNPLSVMCYLALLNSDNTNVCFIATENETLAGYVEAYERIGEDTLSWSITPYSEDETVQDKAFEYSAKYCGPAVMNWKTAWLGVDVEETETILATLAGTVHGANYDWEQDSGDSEVSNRIYVDPQTYDITTVKYGDKVSRDGNVYTVLSVITAEAHPYIMVDALLPVGLISGLKVTRVSGRADIVEKVSARARAFNSELVRVFFADAPVLDDWPEYACPMSYLAAAWAGKRGGSAPHQPLTRAEISGIHCSGKFGFTVDQYNTMAAAGVWLTVTDDSVTYCRHQLTTKNQGEHYELKEDSKVSNAHEISKVYRATLDEYYGRANVTETAMEVIRLRADEVTLTIRSRSWPALLGPQITTVNNISIQKNASFSDRVDLFISLATPDPLNNLDVYLTIQ